MISNTALKRVVTRNDLRLHVELMGIGNAVRQYLAEGKFKQDRAFDCHAICRGVSLYNQTLRTKTGFYMGVTKVERKKGVMWVSTIRCMHSWLKTPDGAIIDTYPVGFIAAHPILVASRGKYRAYGSGLYVEDKHAAEKYSTGAVQRNSKVFFGLIQKACAAFPELL